MIKKEFLTIISALHACYELAGKHISASLAILKNIFLATN